MNDYEKAGKMVGNHFDLVLIASERVREINRQRRDSGELEELNPKLRSKLQPSHQVAIAEIERGAVGREYLNKLKGRAIKKRPKFDEI